MISTSLFPYDSFPVRLEQKNENRVCWFKDDYDLQKHLNRYKLDKRTIKIDYRDKPTVTSKKNKRSVEQKSKSKSDGSVSTVPKRKPKLDPTRNPSSNSKRKK